MTFNPTNPTGWNTGDQITADQMNDLDSKTVDAVDGVGGGLYDGQLIFRELMGIGNTVNGFVAVDTNIQLRPTRDMQFEDERFFVRSAIGVVAVVPSDWRSDLGIRYYHENALRSPIGWRMPNPAGAKIQVIGFWFDPTNHRAVPTGTNRPWLELVEVDDEGNETIIITYYDPPCATVAEYDTSRLIATMVPDYEVDPTAILVCRVYGEDGPNAIAGGRFNAPRIGFSTRAAIPR
jgi:hypothetical protein